MKDIEYNERNDKGFWKYYEKIMEGEDFNQGTDGDELNKY
jgi:hypothetical protein